MKKAFLIVCVCGLLAGCGGLRMPPLASCDGAEKRPLNIGLWNTKDRADLGSKASKC
jgi:hypothetical protein